MHHNMNGTTRRPKAAKCNMLFRFCIGLEQFAEGVVIFDVNKTGTSFYQFAGDDVVIIISETGDPESAIFSKFIFEGEITDVVSERVLIGCISLDVDIAGNLYYESVVQKAL